LGGVWGVLWGGGGGRGGGGGGGGWVGGGGGGLINLQLNRRCGGGGRFPRGIVERKGPWERNVRL